MKEDHLRVFVVEDNEWYNRFLVHNLCMNPEFEVKSFFSGKELLANLHERPDVITIDYRLPDMKGSELLKRIRERTDTVEVIVISEQEDVQTAVDLLREGAFDYLVKNEEMPARLHNAIGKIGRNSVLQKRVQLLEKEVGKKYGFEGSIVGNSEAIRKVHDLAAKAASSNITVVITGETGTGKEVVAKAIHYHSARRDKPFVPVNMSAIPAELFESEFFGHEKGAFTGAVVRRKGKFEEAGYGTLFLDEITDTAQGFQPKLLRALQEKEVTRVGSNETVKIHSRIIVASNKNLQNEVKNGNFRQDLYYRIFGFPIELPPLRDRGQDVLLLARHFIDNFCRENHIPPKALDGEAMAKLLNYPWPGNVRELKSVIELAVIMSGGDTVKNADITFSHSDLLTEILDEEMTMKSYNKKILDHYLHKYNQNIPLVARKLGIGQATVYRMLKR